MKKSAKLSRAQAACTSKTQLLEEEACMNLLRKMLQKKDAENGQKMIQKMDEISVIERTIEYIETLSDTLRHSSRKK